MEIAFKFDMLDIVAKRVLVVDDDPLICWAIQKGLTADRVETHAVGSGAECLDAVMRGMYDLVFLDIHLPDANGIDLLRKIRTISPATQVVIASADGSEANKEQALSAGAVQFIEKPFEISTITQVVISTLWKFAEGRVHPRYICNLPLLLSVLSPLPEDAPFDLDNLCGTAEDVGKEGMRIKTAYPLRKGQSVRLRIMDTHDPFSKFVPGEPVAEVVWVAPGSMSSRAGLRFLAAM